MVVGFQQKAKKSRMVRRQTNQKTPAQFRGGKGRGEFAAFAQGRDLQGCCWRCVLSGVHQYSPVKRARITRPIPTTMVRK